MQLYQTKVSDSDHDKLRDIGYKLLDQKLIRNNSKYELTKFALNTIIEMFSDKEVLELDR